MNRIGRASGPPSFVAGLATSVAAVAVATAVIYPLKSIAPTVSLGVVYIPAVLLISVYWGLGLGLFASLASATAFNFFHIPPVGYFTIADGRNWVALAAFALIAAVTSKMADLARTRAIEAERRREEADLAAELARLVLSEPETSASLRATSTRVADALGTEAAEIELGEARAGEGQLPVVLTDTEGAQIATLLVPETISAGSAEFLRSRLAPALGALIGIAKRRDALQAEAVEAAALRRSDELKTALLRSVSHDLRTPLTAIVATGHALGAKSLTDDERGDLSAAVVDEGQRLSRLVENLLDLSRLEAGRAEPRREWVSIEEVLLASKDVPSGDGGGEIRFSVDPDLPALHADADQLERAFGNLIENARRYSGDQPVSIRARGVGSRLVVRIVDRGPGIRLADRDRIFEPFYRGATNGRRQVGSGLGLAIAKGFIEANGGEIAVESLPGQGTTFVVTFPIELQAEPVR